MMFANDPGHGVHRGVGQDDVILFPHDRTFLQKRQLPAGGPRKLGERVQLPEPAVQSHVVGIEEALEVVRQQVVLLVALFGDRRFCGGSKGRDVAASAVFHQLSQQLSACHRHPPWPGVLEDRPGSDPGETDVDGRHRGRTCCPGYRVCDGSVCVRGLRERILA